MAHFGDHRLRHAAALRDAGVFQVSAPAPPTNTPQPSRKITAATIQPARTDARVGGGLSGGNSRVLASGWRPGCSSPCSVTTSTGQGTSGK